MINFKDKKVIGCIIITIISIILLLIVVYKFSFRENFAGDTNQQPYDQKTPPVNNTSAGIKLLSTDNNGNITIIDAETLFKNIIDTLNGNNSIPGLIPRMNSTQRAVALIQSYLWGNDRTPRDPYNYGDLEGKLINILGVPGVGVSGINSQQLRLNTSNMKHPVTIDRDMLKKLTTDRWLIQSREGEGSTAPYLTLKRRTGDTVVHWDTSNNWNDVMYLFPSYKTDSSGPTNPPMSQRSSKNPSGFRGTENKYMAQDP